jgi:pimeloyl-ACP methyl ester carboxylesterase
MRFPAYLTGGAGLLICNLPLSADFNQCFPIPEPSMDNTMPILLIPGLGGSPRLFAPIVPALWRFGPVTVANHIRDNNIGVIARRILAEAPPRFALAGHSMGGYIAFDIMRQAPDRVAKLALINTQARADTPEAAERRRGQIAAVEAGGFSNGIEAMYPGFVHPSRRDDAALRRLVHDVADDVGPDAFMRQLIAVMGRIRCRRRWPTAFPAPNSRSFRIAATFRRWNSRKPRRTPWSNGCGTKLFLQREPPRSRR